MMAASLEVEEKGRKTSGSRKDKILTLTFMPLTAVTYHTNQLNDQDG